MLIISGANEIRIKILLVGENVREDFAQTPIFPLLIINKLI